MEEIQREYLKHIYPEHRTNMISLYNDGKFGAHTMAVKRFLSVDKINIKDMFIYADQYVPNYEDLPNNGLANFFKLISTLIRATTAQVALALDAEEYCISEANNITKNLGDIKQRLLWERSDEVEGLPID